MCYKEGVEFWDCKDEQQFKMKYIKKMQKGLVSQRIFCIETEETVRGFPDVMEIISGTMDNRVYFYEFKFSDKNGKIKFQPTQPAFYKKNPDLRVCVIAFNAKTGNVHKFYANDIFNPNSFYKMNLKAEVNLNKAEGEI